jgi:hypothetical protein
MAYVDMFSELQDLVPGLSRIRSKKLVRRAFQYVQDSNLWSFQCQQGSFSTPNISTAGSVTFALGSSQVVGDAAASAQWLSLPFQWRPTTQQIRAQGYTVYSIIAMDATNPDAVVLTLDRLFTDPLPFYSGVAYQMYQAYIPAPKGFKRWLNVSDMFDMWSMDIWTTVRTENLLDPARQIASNPWAMLPIGADLRGQGTLTPSATLGQQLYELYPYPTVTIPYEWWAIVDWPQLENNSDELPFPITEEVVTQKALTWAYRDAESRRDVMAAKGSGGNYLALKRQAEEDFLDRLKTLRLRDGDAVDNFLIKMKAATVGWAVNPWFNSITMKSSPF